MLRDKENYDLGNARSPLSRLFFLRPAYFSSSEAGEPPRRQIFLRLLAPLFCYLGYRLGLYESNEENALYAGSTLTEFTSEDRIVDILLNKKKAGVLIMLYSPGHILELQYYNDFEKASALSQHKDIDF